MSKVAAQHRTMIEAVENHMPEVVIVVRISPSLPSLEVCSLSLSVSKSQILARVLQE